MTRIVLILAAGLIFVTFGLMGVSLLGFNPFKAGPPDPQGLQSLQGRWVIVRGVERGKEEKVSGDDSFAFEFNGDTMVMRDQLREEILRYMIRVNPKADPPEMDLIYPNGRIDLAIYRIDGKHMKICMIQSKHGSRPLQFLSEPGSKKCMYEFMKD